MTQYYMTLCDKGNIGKHVFVVSLDQKPKKKRFWLFTKNWCETTLEYETDIKLLYIFDQLLYI